MYIQLPIKNKNCFTVCISNGAATTYGPSQSNSDARNRKEQRGRNSRHGTRCIGRAAA